MPRLTSLLVVLVLVAASRMASAAPQIDARFQVESQVRAIDTSADGRFSVSAEASYTPNPRSTDGRYALKAVNADCAPLPDALFAHGFENP